MGIYGVKEIFFQANPCQPVLGTNLDGGCEVLPGRVCGKTKY